MSDWEDAVIKKKRKQTRPCMLGVDLAHNSDLHDWLRRKSIKLDATVSEVVRAILRKAMEADI